MAVEFQPADEDAIYRQIGRFVVFFQSLESELISLTSLALDPESAGWNARPRLARLRFQELVDKTAPAVLAFTKEHRGDVPEFQRRLEDLLARCRELARYRNGVIHSAYVHFEASDKVVAVVRSDARAPDEHEYLDGESFNDALLAVAHVGFALAQCRVQLLQWHGRRARAE